MVSASDYAQSRLAEGLAEGKSRRVSPHKLAELQEYSQQFGYLEDFDQVLVFQDSLPSPPEDRARIWLAKAKRETDKNSPVKVVSYCYQQASFLDPDLSVLPDWSSYLRIHSRRRELLSLLENHANQLCHSYSEHRARDFVDAVRKVRLTAKESWHVATPILQFAQRTFELERAFACLGLLEQIGVPRRRLAILRARSWLLKNNSTMAQEECLAVVKDLFHPREIRRFIDSMYSMLGRHDPFVADLIAYVAKCGLTAGLDMGQRIEWKVRYFLDLFHKPKSLSLAWKFLNAHPELMDDERVWLPKYEMLKSFARNEELQSHLEFMVPRQKRLRRLPQWSRRTDQKLRRELLRGRSVHRAYGDLSELEAGESFPTSCSSSDQHLRRLVDLTLSGTD